MTNSNYFNVLNNLYKQRFHLSTDIPIITSFKNVSYVCPFIEASEKLKLMFLIEKQIREQECEEVSK